MNLTPAFLHSQRTIADPVADTLLTNLIDMGYHAGDSIKLFDALRKNSDAVPQDAPDIVKQYFNDTAKLPDWADTSLIKRGEELFNLHGPLFVVGLFCASLPACYAGKNGVQVLYSTGRLNEKRGQIEPLQRRIAETAQFVIDVMSEGGLTDPNGRGIRTTQKIRLIHGSIRHFIAAAPSWHTVKRDAAHLPPEAWDTTKLGVPINQEDLAGTMLAFSSVAVDTVKTLGVNLNNDDEEAYFHAWRIVGHILGVQPQMMPQNIAEGRALWQAIDQDQFAASDEGQALTRALINFLQYILPGNVFDNLPEALMKELMGDRIAQMLALKPNKLDEIALHLLKGPLHFLEDILNITTDHSAVLRNLAEALSHFLMQSMTLLWNDGKQVHFYVPPSLQGSWDIDAAKPTTLKGRIESRLKGNA